MAGAEGARFAPLRAVGEAAQAVDPVPEGGQGNVSVGVGLSGAETPAGTSPVGKVECEASITATMASTIDTSCRRHSSIRSLPAATTIARIVARFTSKPQDGDVLPGREPQPLHGSLHVDSSCVTAAATFEEQEALGFLAHGPGPCRVAGNPRTWLPIRGHVHVRPPRPRLEAVRRRLRGS